LPVRRRNGFPFSFSPSTPISFFKKHRKRIIIITTIRIYSTIDPSLFGWGGERGKSWPAAGKSAGDDIKLIAAAAEMARPATVSFLPSQSEEEVGRII
jgi:hypothetical protein